MCVKRVWFLICIFLKKNHVGACLGKGSFFAGKKAPAGACLGKGSFCCRKKSPCGSLLREGEFFCRKKSPCGSLPREGELIKGLNGVAVARHGLKLWENGATACKMLMDTFLDQNLMIFDWSDQEGYVFLLLEPTLRRVLFFLIAIFSYSVAWVYRGLPIGCLP